MTAGETLLVAGRIVTGGAFFVLGLTNIRNHAPLTELMRSRHMPLPALSAAVGIGMQVVFGGMMLVGAWPVVAAFGLAVFVVMATALAHWPFDKTGAERQSNITACLANGVMLGGLLTQAATGF